MLPSVGESLLAWVTPKSIFLDWVFLPRCQAGASAVLGAAESKDELDFITKQLGWIPSCQVTTMASGEYTSSLDTTLVTVNKS